MLITRIITALVGLAIVLIGLFAVPAWAWGVFTLAVVLAAFWEWRRFCVMSPPTEAAYLAISAALSAAILFAYLKGSLAGIDFTSLKLAGFTIAAVFWLMLAPLWLARGWRSQSPALMALTGWVVIFPTGLALLSLRDVSPWAIFSFAAIVWVADISAYFVGRRFGKHKLAPSISPGKTIEGVAGGVLGVMIFFVAWYFLIGGTPLGEQEWARELKSHSGLLFGLFVVLSLLSVLGDLFESWMKRGAGLKDSGNLLPGHGGILDRIDALTSTLPIAALYVMLLSSTY